MKFSLFLFAAASLATIADELSSRTDRFSTLLNAVTSNNLTSVFTGAGPLTLFAPTNTAFAALTNSTPNALSNATYVTGVLTYHVLPNQKFVPGNATKVIAETALNLPGPGLDKVPGGQKVVIAVSTNNGTTSVKVGEATVTESIEASNGIIHVIDKVLIPPRPVSNVLMANGFGMFSSALSLAGLTQTFDDLSNVTIFVQTDADILSSLIVMEGPAPAATLKTIFSYHAVPGVYYSTDLTNMIGASVRTLQGNNVTIGPELVPMNQNTSSGISRVVRGIGNTADSRILKADILVDSGVIHVISSTLLPATLSVLFPPVSSASSLVGFGAFALAMLFML